MSDMTLRQLRETQDVLAKDAARRMGCDPSLISKIEDRGTTSIDTIRSYASALGVSLLDAIAANDLTRARLTSPPAQVRRGRGRPPRAVIPA